MAATLKIDTLKFARKLTDAGLDRSVAEAIVEGLSEADTSDLATRSDLGETRSDLLASIVDTRTDLQASIAETRSDLQASIAETRSDLQASIAETRSDLQASIADTRLDLQTRIAATKSELQASISAVQVDLAETKAELLRFMLVQAVAIVGLTVTLVKLLP